MPPKDKASTEGKRKKIVRACKDCRRRKVKCDGETPCSTCKRSSVTCIFESSTPKRGANKQYIESLENRIQVMEKAIHSLGGMQMIEEAMRKQQLLDDPPVKAEEGGENRFVMNEMGSPYYIQDIMNSSTTGDSQSSRCSSPKNAQINPNTNTRQDELVHFFMMHIQPSFSLFLPDAFNPLYSAHETPAVLIYAICALSLAYQPSTEEEKSHYYHKTIQMLDEWVGRPCVEMIQTLLILVKYTENNQEGYFERSKSLLQRAVELCKILELDRLIYHPDATSPESETKKRAFYMVLRYHVLLCVEQNLELELLVHKDALPSSLGQQETERLLFHFSITLAHIYTHLRRVTKRQELQMDRRDENQIVEETLAVMQLQYMMDEDMLRLPHHLVLHQPKQLQFPADALPTSGLSLSAKLVYIHHHLNGLLLHFHYCKHPLPQGSTEVIHYPHQDIALASASAMVRWVESLLLDPVFRLVPRGLPWLNYCSAFAFSVLQPVDMTWPEEYRRAMQLTQHLAAMSPYHEMRSLAREMGTSAHSSPVIQPKARRNTIADRPNTSIPTPFLQLSSTDLSFSFQQSPFEAKRTLRNTSQSCMDLRSMNQIHAAHHPHRKSIHTVSSSLSTAGPYRHGSPTKTSYTKPYDLQALPRQQQNKIRKSSSLQALSNHSISSFQPPPPPPPPQPPQPPQPPSLLDYSSLMPATPFPSSPFLDSNEFTEGQFSLPWSELDFQTHHSILNEERTEGHALL